MKKWLCSLLFFTSVDVRAFQDLEAFTNWVKVSRFSSMEEMISKLPPEYRSNYTLMKGSIGLQEASLDAPRALLYGNEARFLFTFNAKPAQGGFEDFEIMFFNDQSKIYEFQVVKFTSQGVSLSEKNPSMCTACHSEFAKPLWGSLGDYPRAFGAQDDYLDSDELEALSWLKENPRMKHLLRDDLVNPHAPYRQHGQRGEMSLQNRPNARLGSLLENLYSQTLAARIQPKFLAEYIFLTKAFLGDSYLVSAQDFWQQLQPLIQSELTAEQRWDLERVIGRLAKTDRDRVHFAMTALMFEVDFDPWVLDQVGGVSPVGAWLSERSLKAAVLEQLNLAGY